MAGCLLIDILTSYRPYLQDFFGPGGLGGSRMFAYYGEAPKLNWSLLRGFGDPLLSALALGVWIALSVWLVLRRCRKPDALARKHVQSRGPPSLARRAGIKVQGYSACGSVVQSLDEERRTRER